MPELRDVDEDNGEFWVGNPFMFSNVKENLSAYERNGCFLNDRNGSFLDMSYLSGSDNRGDSRTIVSADINKDGMPELLVRQVGGGAIVVYKNNFPNTSQKGSQYHAPNGPQLNKNDSEAISKQHQKMMAQMKQN